MKLNDDQRKVMQALLDGKIVKARLTRNDPFCEMPLGWIIQIGDGETKYQIKEPAVKVALIKRHGRIVAVTESEFQEMSEDNWLRVSDWVEIAPITTHRN